MRCRYAKREIATGKHTYMHAGNTDRQRYTDSNRGRTGTRIDTNTQSETNIGDRHGVARNTDTETRSKTERHKKIDNQTDTERDRRRIINTGQHTYIRHLQIIRQQD